MSLKSLAFTVLPSSTRSPVDARRLKTIERLQEQKQLVENPNYVKTVKKWATVNGQAFGAPRIQRHLEIFPGRTPDISPSQSSE